METKKGTQADLSTLGQWALGDAKETLSILNKVVNALESGNMVQAKSFMDAYQEASHALQVHVRNAK